MRNHATKTIVNIDIILIGWMGSDPGVYFNNKTIVFVPAFTLPNYKLNLLKLGLENKNFLMCVTNQLTLTRNQN